MPFVTLKQSPAYHQMTLDELLFGAPVQNLVINFNEANTRTFLTASPAQKLLDYAKPWELVGKLEAFNTATAPLRAVENRHDLYHSFVIPKKSGGLRHIDAPNDDLMFALRRLKSLFENDFHALYHTSAFAYVPKRCTVDAIKRHQANESRWFLKFDFHDFFGSTTKEFVMKQLERIFPFSEVVKSKQGRDALSTAIDLAFLDGGLPQGTPFSPMITNIMMIPIDFELCNRLKAFEVRRHGAPKDAEPAPQRFVYTRYADDILISSRYDFDERMVEKLLMDVLRLYDAPFTLNRSKTRYGSSAGSNWNLGIVLNKDNQITVGHKKKREFKAILASYMMDHLAGKPWNIEDVRYLDGISNYYQMVEPDTIHAIIEHAEEKFNVCLKDLLKADLSRKTA